ncbi:hypothetical protein [Cellulosimicrobium sp. Marseille-Q4280]|uniref:hypothetical protein n=1 Tax=Cellulosimicrobium sp. Marseille-Q4280 TaxID=2937992 RepID=UPI00203C79E5|nr:hypothetical protein [Cellulosimicrobium sp. Marseille-Q4280]
MTYPTDTAPDVTTLDPQDGDSVRSFASANGGQAFDLSDGDGGDLDPLDLGDGDEGDEGDDDGEQETTAAGTTGTARRTGPNKAGVRRIGSKLLQLQGADADDLAVLASLYGVEADPLEVTVAVMTTDRSALTAVKDLTDIAEADGPFQAMVVAQEKGRARMKGVHSLLVALDAASAASLNGNDAKAGAALAQDVVGLADEAKSSLSRVLDLARRTV